MRTVIDFSVGAVVGLGIALVVVPPLVFLVDFLRSL